MSDPKIGDWYARCCIHDLYEFHTKDEIESFKEDMEEMPGLRYWPSLYDALRDLEPETWGDEFGMGMIWAFGRMCGYAPKKGVGSTPTVRAPHT